MNSLRPEWAEDRITCQMSGRGPTICMGLGTSESPSRMRMPNPPQNRTTFTGIPQILRGEPSPRGCGRGRAPDDRPRRRVDDLEAGDREHEPTTPLGDGRELGGDLV